MWPFLYINDVLSLNNSKFGDFVNRIYRIELEIKDTTAGRSASYIDLHLEIDSEGRLKTKLYYKRDDFNFPIVNFPFICSNISTAHSYGVYLSVDTIFQSHHFESLTVATMTWLTVIEYLCYKWPWICSTSRKHFPVLSSFMTYHCVCTQIKTTGATSWAGTAYLSGAPEFTPGF